MRAAFDRLMEMGAEASISAAGAAYDAATEGGRRPLVLLGAGQMGRAVHAALLDKPVKVLCFADNDPTRWGQVLGGIPVFSPRAAARQYGEEAVFVVAFQAEAAVLGREEARLAAMGARRICPFSDLFRKWPETSGWPCGTPAFYREHQAALAQTLDLFEDEASRQQFLGHLRWRMIRDVDALPVGTPEDQYFCPDLVRLRDDECLVDGGAFDGDTLRAFLRARCEAFGRVHAFEPDPNSHAALRTFLACLPADLAGRIRPYQAALGAGAGVVHLQAQGDHLSAVGATGTPVPVMAVDDLPRDLPITFLKLDLEGSERPALAGARDTLARDRPVLAVAIYHHPGDLFGLPLLIRDRCEDYRFHLRTHNRFGLDVVLYAVPRERTR